MAGPTVATMPGKPDEEVTTCAKGMCKGTERKEEEVTTCAGGVRAGVQAYYGRDLQSGADVRSQVNCLAGRPPLPKHVQDAYALVHPDITLKYYGCGPSVPEALEGLRILDLGSGSGRDCFALAKLTGSDGHVNGVDMTREQVDFAQSYLDHHMAKFGFTTPNLTFTLGYIEHLAEADSSVDLAISNCVICLCPDKRAVFTEVARVLKDGGELYWSDMYSDRAVPDDVTSDRVLWGEGMGAQQWTALYDLAAELGLSKPRLVTATMVDTAEWDHRLGGAKLVSVTYRAFKLPRPLRAASRATYQGGIQGCDASVQFDHATTFKRDEAVTVDAELATILGASRFKKYFLLEDPPKAAMNTCTADPKVDPIQWAEERGLKRTMCGKS